MSWKDRYTRGSFRGVPFLTSESKTTIGQRKAVYEHPFSDSGVTALALGRRARRFSLQTFVIGPDYDRARDALIEALEKPGPGLLVHPYLGSILVEVDSSVTVYEANSQGGMAEIAFDAQEARGGTASAAPVSKPDTGARTAARASAVRVAARAALERDLSLKDVRDFAASANLKTLDRIVTDLRELNGTISTALAVPARFAHQISDIADQTVTLIQAPGELFDTLSDAMALVFASVTKVAGAAADEVRPESEAAEALDAVRASARGFGAALLGAPGLGADADPAISATNAAQRRNHAALKHNLRAAAVSHLADAAAEQTYDSAQDARAARDRLTEALERASAAVISGYECDASVLDALQELRGAVFAHLSALELAQLTTVSAVEIASSLTLAYELYGDAARAGEIEARNNLPHPGFVTGTVEVLSV